MVIVLDNVRSIHNVASIFRTANGAGIEKIYACGFTPSPLDRFGTVLRDFAKVALGAERAVSWEKMETAAAAVQKLKKAGYMIIAAELSPEAIPYHTLKLKRADLAKTAVIFGHETEGISPALLKKADKVISIPMNGAKESLNVSVAAGIVLYGLQY